MHPRNTTALLSHDKVLHLLREARKSAKNSSLKKPFICSICNKAFAGTDSLSRHLHRIHMQHSITCHTPGCLKTFAFMTDLREHLRSHSNKRAYPCTDCDKGFKYQSCLYRHAKKKHPEQVAGRNRIQEGYAGGSQTGPYVSQPPEQITQSAADSTTPHTNSLLLLAAATQMVQLPNREEDHLMLLATQASLATHQPVTLPSVPDDADL